MLSKPSVSVGIPAYNEEANIGKIITQLLTQKQDSFELSEIIIISDGSTDRTVAQAESINDGRIKVIKKGNREGAASRQNDIIEIFKGDILVILNADIYLHNDEFISTLIKPFTKNRNIGIVGAKVTPLTAANFFEKVINTSVELKSQMYEQINNRNNIYLCHGRARAFSRAFASILKFPKLPGEDAYSYIKCINSGFEFYYEDKAEVFYRSPQILSDHLKQSKRFFIAKNVWEREYNGNVNSYYYIPKAILLKTFGWYFFQNPLLLTSYLGIYILARITSLWYQTSSLWEVALSSKTIVK